MATFKNALTQKLGIQYPIMLAGMAGISGPPLVAAVRSLYYHDFTPPRTSYSHHHLSLPFSPLTRTKYKLFLFLVLVLSSTHISLSLPLLVCSRVGVVLSAVSSFALFPATHTIRPPKLLCAEPPQQRWWNRNSRGYRNVSLDPSQGNK